jgi:uncharacterized caspase-like protein
MAQRHIALVIGNADYKEAPLRNPLNDALDMAQSLRDLRFEVIEVRNVTRRAMIEAVNTFGARLQQAHVGLFYYSGHGVQHQGTNYLIPLQAMITAPADLEQEAVDARRILGRMEQSQTTLNIVILDACRNNPFRNLLGFRSFGERGLAPLPRVRSSLIAYATQPDNVAEDGTGRNGTYTKHLLRYLKQPGLTLPDLFIKVGLAVLQETNHKQEPWVSFSPLPRFCFAGCAPSSLPVSPPQATGGSPPNITASVQAGPNSGSLPSGTRLRITDIASWESSYYGGREKLVGKTAIAKSIIEQRPNGWWHGEVILDQPLFNGDHRIHKFSQFKLERLQ